MKSNFKYIYLLLMLVFAASCVTNKNTRLLQEKASLPVYDSVPFHEYRLKVNDELNLKVNSMNTEINKAFNLGVQTTSTSSSSSIAYRIYQDGTIDIPFVDSIPVVGITIMEAEQIIENRLKLVSEDITVKLQLANNYFYLLGSSGRGKYPIYKDKLTIYQAIALANFSPGVGNLKDVKIIREQNNISNIVSFDLRTESVINSEYYYIQPNDIIYIETSKGNFFKIQSFTSLIGLFSSSLTFLLLMLEYTK